MRYLLLCSCMIFGMRSENDSRHYEQSKETSPDIPMSEMPTNPVIVLANVIRRFFRQQIYIPSPHASLFSRHWNGWMESLLIAILLAGLLSFVTNVFILAFRSVGLFEHGPCKNIVAEPVVHSIDISNLTYITGNITHEFYSIPVRIND